MANTAIRPFRIAVPDADLVDLRERLARTRWPEREPVSSEDAVNWTQGIPLDYMRELTAYWAQDYDWRVREARLNTFEQFVTEIDGLDIHFIHRRCANPDALPLVITHGWPGSIAEFAKVIEPLARDFHVVCPSLPGYGFSGKPAAPGWNVQRIAAAWDSLMARLGYQRYGAQGGDWGAMVTTEIGRNAGSNRAGCIAIHLNMPVAPPPGPIENPTPDEVAAMTAFDHYKKWDSGYSKQQSTRPQTLGYGLADSPVGQLAWIVEKFWAWTDCDGHPENVLTKDEMLDDVMLYWLTNSAASSARLYWESLGVRNPGKVGKDNPGKVGKDTVPTGVASFPKEIIKAPRRWCENAYAITHWADMPRGGHFAAFEQPELFVGDVRAFFSEFSVANPAR
ncbi:MAG: epoxide hydrolase [Mycobacterium sp.]|nr:epoxide hydrolase [Mycobacterium sp.]